MVRLGKASILGLLIGILGLLFSFFPFMLELEENYGLQILFQRRGAKHAPSDVIIVSLNREFADYPEKSTNSNQRPWPRSLYGRLTEILASEGAAVVAFNLIFDSASLEDEDDQAFADAIRQARNVVLLEYLKIDTVPLLDENQDTSGGVHIEKWIPPIFPLAQAAIASAPFPLPRVPVKLSQYWTFKTSPFGSAPTLPAVAFQIFALEVYDEFVQLLGKVSSSHAKKLPRNKDVLLATTNIRKFIRMLREIFENQPFIAEMMLKELQRAKTLSDDKIKSRLLTSLIRMYQSPDSQHLNFYGPSGTVTTVPYKIVLEPQETSSVIQNRPDFRGKAVFVGFPKPIRPETLDGFYTVFSQANGVDLTGVEIAATAFGNLLENMPVRPLRPPAYLIAIFLWGMVIGLLGRLFSDVIVTGIVKIGLRALYRRRFSDVIATGIVMIGLSTLYLSVAQNQFDATGSWYPLIIPLGIQVPIAFFSAVVWEYLDPLEVFDPTEVAKQFFSRAGFEKVEPLSSKILLLYSKDSHISGMAALWQEGPHDESQSLSATILSSKKKLETGMKLYLIYRNQGPSSDTIQFLRKVFHCEIIPFLSSILERALSINDCDRILKELEEPYLTRIDPYAESKPIHDPTWFYGRDDFLNRLPAILAQGQHVGIFGLRKVGKTSLTNQLRQRFAATPTVFMDCQGFSAKSEIFFAEIIKQLHEELHSLGIKRLPRLQPIADREDFRRQFFALCDIWEKSEQRGPFLIILDEIDKFFPSREVKNSENILAEFVRFFRVLRGLAQSRQCLVTLVVAYRPDVNRYNQLTPSVGENPMFQSLQEEFLGFLGPANSEAMIREIGLWKQIIWDIDAAQRGFHYCGGHPLITRFFASHVCQEGTLKAIDYARVEETAMEILATLRKNEIGNYYKEGIWDLLRHDEQHVLRLICQSGHKGVAEAEIPDEFEDALTNLEHFGLVINIGDSFHISAHLFHTWLQRRFGL